MWDTFEKPPMKYTTRNVCFKIYGLLCEFVCFVHYKVIIILFCGLARLVYQSGYISST